MARASMLLVIAGCVMLAAVSVQAEKKNYAFELYERDLASNQIEAFGPKDSNDQVGTGYIYNNTATATVDPNSKPLGSVAGLYFYINELASDELFSIKFENNEFAGGELHVRGVWSSKKDGSYEQIQRLSIVGV